ncbi:MAG TPA: hypothetical protein VFF73_13345 [Planctomycetota bacterium]|nr:hypothetical protein [Planctomycetota bacterium]
MKRALRPRASLARRFVDFYLSTIARASKPLVRMKLFFVLVTASFFVHLFVVYGDYVLGDHQLLQQAKLDQLKPEKHMEVKLRPHEDLAKVMAAVLEQEKRAKDEELKLKKEEEDLKKLEKEEPKKPEPPKEEPKKPEPKKEEEKAPAKKLENESIAEKAKDDSEVKRRVILNEKEKAEKAQKDAKNKGGDTNNTTGVTEKPKDEKLALQGVEKSAPDVKEKPKPELAAKNPKELEEAAKAKEAPKPSPTPPPPATPDGEEKPKGELIDLKTPILAKKQNPGQSPIERDGEKPNVVAKVEPPKTPPPPVLPPPPPPPPPVIPPPPPPPPVAQPLPPAPPPVESGDNVKKTVVQKIEPKPAPPTPVTPPKQDSRIGVGSTPPPQPKVDEPKPKPREIKPTVTPPQTPKSDSTQFAGRKNDNAPKTGALGNVVASKAPARPPGPTKNPSPLVNPKPAPPHDDPVVTDHTEYRKNAIVVEKNLKVMDDWISYTLEGSPQLKDTNVPGLFITNTSDEEWKDIISHFDLCPIAFPDTADRFLLVDISSGRPRSLEKDQFAELKDHYASSGIRYSGRRLRGNQVMWSVAERVCSECGISTAKINVMILLPPKVASYIAWKALRTIKDEGFDQKKVRACHTRFARTTDGWILKVTDIVLEDGTVRQVKA